MTIYEALEILGLDEGASREEIKSKYRKLLHKYHPDSGVTEDKEEEYHKKTVKINEAYEILSKRKPGTVHKRKAKTEPKEDFGVWKAPLLENAYEAREILQPVEDSEGNELANITVAKGKFYWTKDEDFKLFLLSIYNLSKSLLDLVDDKLRREERINKTVYQAELAYILARQFINDTDAIRFVLGEGSVSDDGTIVYRIRGMLEKNKFARTLGKSEFLYPEKIVNHRLYLKDKAGKSLGYLSFNDDRLYYIIVPMFEARKVQVMVMQNGESNKITDLLVWIKVSAQEEHSIEPDYNDKIKRLLSMYETEAD